MTIARWPSASGDKKRQAIEECQFSATKETEREPSVGKVMASVFWDCKQVLMIGYLQKGWTINGKYYTSNLHQLNEAIKSKHQEKLHAGVLLL